MPRDNIGQVITSYYWELEAGKDLPRVGDLFVTTQGTGYLLNRMKASSKPGRIGLVVTRVNHEDPGYEGIPVHQWSWLSAQP